MCVWHKWPHLARRSRRGNPRAEVNQALALDLMHEQEAQQSRGRVLRPGFLQKTHPSCLHPPGCRIHLLMTACPGTTSPPSSSLSFLRHNFCFSKGGPGALLESVSGREQTSCPFPTHPASTHQGIQVCPWYLINARLLQNSCLLGGWV